MIRKQDDPSYSVGYGKPPRESRFQPGQSGNPKGRPKGSETFKTKVQKALSGRVSVSVNGKSKRMSFEDAALMSLMQGLLKAPPDKKIAILKFLQSFRDDDHEAATDELDFAILDDDELDQFEKLYSKLLGVENDA